MWELLGYKFFQYALIAALLGGASLGIVGVWVVLIGIPFIGVALSHAAFAGGVVGMLLGINPVFMAFVFSLIASLSIGPLSERSRIEPNISIGIIFSLVLGIAFLGIGFMKGSRNEAFSLIWGSILTLSRWDILMITVFFFFVLLFLLKFNMEIKAIIYNKKVAHVAGIPVFRIFYLLLFVTGFTVTVNLNTVGGLLIFSLLINPSSAASLIAKRIEQMYLLSALFGVVSCVCGLLVSALFNIPSGSVIIIVSSVIFLVTFLLNRRRIAEKRV